MSENHLIILNTFKELISEIERSPYNVPDLETRNKDFQFKNIQSLIKEVVCFMENLDLLNLISTLTKQTNNQQYCKDLIKVLILPVTLFKYTSKPTTNRINKNLNKIAKPIKDLFLLLEKERYSKKIISKETVSYLGGAGYHLKELNILKDFIESIYHNHYNSAENNVGETLDKLFYTSVSYTSAVKIPELYVYTPFAFHTLSGDTNRCDLYKSLLRHTIRSIMEISTDSQVRLEKEHLIFLIQTKIDIEIKNHNDNYFIGDEFLNSVYQNFKTSIQKQRKQGF
ncbi:MAG: hypothetical protein ACJAS4_001417 [Bacteriovoracaceae bacterium]|jgi:hypothetical protein